jgi:hypothetical protein
MRQALDGWINLGTNGFKPGLLDEDLSESHLRQGWEFIGSSAVMPETLSGKG